MRRSEGRAVASARSGLAVSRANPLRQRRRISGRGFWKIDRLNLQASKGSAVLRAAKHLPVPGARAHLPSRSKAFDSRRAHFLREPTSTPPGGRVSVQAPNPQKRMLTARRFAFRFRSNPNQEVSRPRAADSAVRNAAVPKAFANMPAAIGLALRLNSAWRSKCRVKNCHSAFNLLISRHNAVLRPYFRAPLAGVAV